MNYKRLAGYVSAVVVPAVLAQSDAIKALLPERAAHWFACGVAVLAVVKSYSVDPTKH